MSRTARNAFWALAFVATIGAAGCGQSSGGVPVRGHVAYKGEPLTQSALTFFPERGRSNLATTDAAGDYHVELQPGEYAVTVNISVQLPPGWKEGDPVPPQKIILPAEYTTRARSTLKATVEKGQSVPIDFALK